MAAEIGHIGLVRDGIRCACGRSGCRAVRLVGDRAAHRSDGSSPKSEKSRSGGSPRPMPTATRPPLRWSSVIRCLATHLRPATRERRDHRAEPRPARSASRSRRAAPTGRARRPRPSQLRWSHRKKPSQPWPPRAGPAARRRRIGERRDAEAEAHPATLTAAADRADAAPERSAPCFRHRLRWRPTGTSGTQTTSVGDAAQASKEETMQSSNPVFRNSEGFNGRAPTPTATRSTAAADLPGLRHAVRPATLERRHAGTRTPGRPGPMTIDTVVQKTAITLASWCVAAFVTWVMTRRSPATPRRAQKTATSSTPSMGRRPRCASRCRWSTRSSG